MLFSIVVVILFSTNPVLTEPDMVHNRCLRKEEASFFILPQFQTK